MHIETWQLIWHIWSFVLVVIAGVFMSIATHHTWQHARFFYKTYYSIIILIFLCELPFIYIIHRVVVQAIKKNKKQEQPEPEDDEEAIDRAIDKALEDKVSISSLNDDENFHSNATSLDITLTTQIKRTESENTGQQILSNWVKIKDETSTEEENVTRSGSLDAFQTILQFREN